MLFRKQNTLTTIIIIIIIIAFIAFLVYQNKSNNIDILFDLKADTPLEVQMSDDEAKAQEESVAKIKENRVGVYEHKNPNFSFSYPEGFNIGVFPERDGEIILVQGDGNQLGLQVFVAPYDGSTVTLSDISSSIPDLDIYEPHPVDIGGVGSGVAFIQKDSSGSLTREVWFEYKNYLFQITSFAKYEELLQKVLETFQFKF